MKTQNETDPTHSLISNMVNDDFEADTEYDDETGLRNSFKKVLTKKRIVIVSGLLTSITFVIAITLVGVYVTRHQRNNKFKNNLKTHINAKFPSIDKSLVDQYVSELTEYYKKSYISADHEGELEALINFNDFVEKFNREHKDKNERRDRFLTFRNNYFEITKSNPNDTYTKGINNFSDMTKEEFYKLFPPVVLPSMSTETQHLDSTMKARLLNKTYLKNLQVAKSLDSPITSLSDITGENLDWRKSNGVTPVKDQGLCGSCWAFASVGSVESLYRIQKNKTLSLSEQELVNCEKRSHGCEGGFGDTALEYIKNNGVSTSLQIPYHANDEKCTVMSKDKFFIKSLLITRGLDVLNKSLVLSPTVIYMGASNELTMYKSGVYNGSCAKDLNHAVLLVGEGYDEKLNKRYWIIKNSWGPYWGENGFLRLERTNVGTDKCGVMEIGITPNL